MSDRVELVEELARAMAEQDALGATADGPRIHRCGWQPYAGLVEAALARLDSLGYAVVKREPSDLDLGCIEQWIETMHYAPDNRTAAKTLHAVVIRSTAAK